jgi:hypothetical protein
LLLLERAEGIDVAETDKRAGGEAWFDIVILGGGSAGCVLVARLSADTDTRGAPSI